MSDLFLNLTPDHVLDAVEQIGFRSTGRCYALNSLENRVYEVEMEDNTKLVGKFYRPGRWTKECILEEHEFLKELNDAEVPVVPPLVLKSGSTVEVAEGGIFFSVFPKARGRAPEELTSDQLKQLGRFLARIHVVGAQKKSKHRRQLTPETYGRESLELLTKGQWIAPEVQTRYKAVVEEILSIITPWFNGVKLQRIHGDCHMGNILYNGDSPFILDFDDMVMGPTAQDIWLLVGGHDEEAMKRQDDFLSGYDEMKSFDRNELKLVEPLRALRIIHYSAWIAKRWEDPAFKRIFTEFTGYKYWAQELEVLEMQLQHIKSRSQSLH